jgi:hypothetical protein
MDLALKGGNGRGQLTATAGTKITRLIPALVGGFTRLIQLVYAASTTAHTLTVLRSLGRTRANANAAAGQPNVVLQADPGPTGDGIAAGDWVVIRTAADNVCRLYVVSSWTSGTSTLVLTTNLVAAVTARDSVWLMGVEADTDPRTGEAQPSFPAAASATTTYSDSNVGLVGSNNADEPLVVVSNNATAAGTLELTTFGYTSA